MKYLHNVATLDLDRDLCTGCGMCAVVCPHTVFSLENGKARTGDRDACMECGACSRNCPEGAIFVQTGVGCAQAVINTALGRTGSCSCTLDGYEGSSSDCQPTVAECGPPDDICGSGPVSHAGRGSGCEDGPGDCGCAPKPKKTGQVGCC